METTTQPILCCLGESVAGQPTQFLMERAFTARGLDWRALSVEVPPELLNAALEGMFAMRFSALRVFSTLQREAANILAPKSVEATFVGGITSGTCGLEGWSTWHHQGHAILEWITAERRLDHVLLWLHGDSIRCRSLLAALEGLQPLGVIWSNGPAEIPEHLTTWRTNDVPRELVTAPGAPDASFDDAVELEEVEAIAIIGEDFASFEFHPRFSNHPLLITAPEAGLEQFRRFQLPNCLPWSPFEQALACEAYDFRRWTGVEPDRATMRDAYDEFCDF